MEPTEAQFLVFNALDTLALINYDLYDRARGSWYIDTPSPVLPRSVILPSGEVVPFEWVQDDDEN